VTRAFGRPAISRWGFENYLRIAPPEFALAAPPPAGRVVAAAAA
jgi:hypothetical protein